MLYSDLVEEYIITFMVQVGYMINTHALLTLPTFGNQYTLTPRVYVPIISYLSIWYMLHAWLKTWTGNDTDMLLLSHHFMLYGFSSLGNQGGA